MPSAYDAVVDLAKRRGFFWPAYETYGGSAGLYVLGNLGVKLADKIVRTWKEVFVRKNDFAEVDTPNLVPEAILQASGHVSNFKDPMAECQNCHRRFRADHLAAEAGVKVAHTRDLPELLQRIKCPTCGKIAGWIISDFLTMFETRLGPYANAKGYLRPETAQGIFVEFKRIFETERERLPIGVAQVGRGFRNEISPRQGLVRLREFRMLEVELFFDPENPGCGMLNPLTLETKIRIIAGEGEEKDVSASLGEAVKSGRIVNEWMAYMILMAQEFLIKIGVPREAIRFREVAEEERAHYSRQTFDVEVSIDGFGWLEVAGIAYRTDFDLTAHMKATGSDYSVAVPLQRPLKEKLKTWGINVEKLKQAYPEKWKDIMAEYSKFKDRKGEPPEIMAGVKIDKSVYFIKEEVAEIMHRKFIPHVVEPSFGLERLMLASLCHSYREKEERVILSLPPYLSPVSVCVFPLVSNDEMIKVARDYERRLKGAGFDTFYDESGTIGRRYARADEIGTPLCITVDNQTLQDQTVTFRDRDSWKQYRVESANLEEEVARVIYQVR
ncbi:MAG: glycine--tRNA ligase [Conexivisphaerales archaeon]